MFNFKTGTALAVQQDQYLQKYLAGEKISSKEICDMEQNLWVASASKLAPGNLVIRQWALIDLFKASTQHCFQIFNLLNILSYKQTGNYRLWAEGYSYWIYMMNVLKPWVEKFEFFYDITGIKGIIEKINQGFIATSYSRDGVWYPAPFGDLRNQPLNPYLQIPHEIKSITISNVAFNYSSINNTILYSIKGRPIGCNTHIPLNNAVIKIQLGIPWGFKFYEGYDKKYKNSWEEMKDTFNPKRLQSIPF